VNANWISAGIQPNWQVKKLRYVCSSIKTGSTPSAHLIEADPTPESVRWFTPVDFAESIYLKTSKRGIRDEAIVEGEAELFPEQSVYAVGIGSIGKVGLCEVKASANQQLNVLTPNKTTDARFLAYSLLNQADLLLALANNATLPILNQQRMGDVHIALPSYSTQCAIANYLDHETARLDALVRAKERVLGLLAEKRRALITRAVTRGLDPRTSLRDSGIPWLGKIPAHWNTERSRWLSRERDERSVTGEEEMLTVSHLTGVTPRSEKDVNMFEAETNEGYKICYADDLVINTLWAWMGAMGVANVNGIVSPAYHVYQLGPRLEPAYIDALVRMPVFAQEVTRYSKGVWSSRLRLYPEGFFEVFLPVPPIEEQRAIVAHIAKETAKLDALRSATECTILLIKERRAALIATAVTGRINVVETDT
jgi:type I restriction enzyme S subunit